MAASIAEPTSPARNPWIVSPLADSLIVIGAPILILPILYGLSQIIEPVALAGFVLGASSTGHHLPGFVRAYGDPVLFARYRFRFTVIPPLLFAVIFWFTWNDMHGAILVVAAWGMWHGFMQLYGFARIYDAKGGDASPLAARMDWLMCSIGFGAILIWSTTASLRIADAAEGTGLFFVPLLFSDSARSAAAVVGIGMLGVYAAFTVAQIRRGRRVATLKLVLIATSLVFLYWSWVAAGGAVLLGLAAWEAFHDVQYLAIAWASNRRLAQRPDVRPLLRRLYQPSIGLLVLYVALCLAYGMFANAQGLSASRWVGALLFSLVLTSALLHFYYDGFIWKVREAKTRQDLGIQIPASDAADRAVPVAGATRDRDWTHALLFAVPFAVLAYTGIHRADFEIPMRETIVAAAPSDANQQLKLGFAYQNAQRFAEAEAAYRAAVDLGESSGLAHHNLATTLARSGKIEQAIEAHRQALSADPQLRPSAIALANLLVAEGRGPEAVALLRAAAEHGGDAADLQGAMARALLAASPDAAQVAEAVLQASRAAQNSHFSDPHPLVTLAKALAAQQRFSRAVRLLERAQQLDTRSDPALAARIERDLRAYRAILRPAHQKKRS